MRAAWTPAAPHAAGAVRVSALLLRHWPLSAGAAALALLMLWSMLAPLGGGSHELLLEFPPGARRDGMAVPAEIRLTRGVRDVLLLRNRDSAPVVFGPLRVAAGAELRLPFEDEGSHLFACPPVAGGVVAVRVLAAPGPGWGRLRWRLGNLAQSLRYLPLRSPDD